MKTDRKRKVYMGIWRFMFPIPQSISEIGVKRGVSGTKTKADLLSKEERKVHHFIVKQMAVADEPITAEFIGEKLNMSFNRVKDIVEKLEAMKTFCYRNDSQGINWVYPLSFENTGHKLTVSTGEQFYAAWAADAIATPFVYGRLRNEELLFTVHSECANSGRLMKIELDSNLNNISVDEGSEPMFCIAVMNTAKIKDPSIVDIFWRKSLFFWSEEDARKYQKKTRELKFYMNLNAISIESIKQIQSAIFGLS